MQNFTSRLIGITLIVGGIIGMVLSIAGIVILWRIKPELEAQVMDSLALFERTAQTTQSLLDVIDDTLLQLRVNIDTVESTAKDVASLMENTVASTASLSQMMSTNFVDIINRTTNGLQSAQRSAKIIDDMLGFLANLPLIGNPNYQANSPLSTSLDQVADSLSPLPDSFDSLGQDLDSTSNDLSAIQSSITVLTTSLNDIGSNLDDAQSQVDNYQQIVAELDLKIQQMQERLPRTITWIFWGITLLLAWLIISQIGLITQGIDRFAKKPSL